LPQAIDDTLITNSPAAEDCLKRPQAFLPIESPVDVKKGESIQVNVMARPQDYIIAWVVELPGLGKRFSHTTFNGLLLDRETLTRAQPGRVAELNNRGRALGVVLSYCDGQRTVADVQALVLKDHPDLFPSKQATEGFVQQVLARNTGE
jgi:hypothetical protein